MICLICRQAEVIEGFASVKLQRGEMKYSILQVPARVCPACGEAYLEEAVAVRLLQGAEKMFQMGELDDIRDYQLLSTTA